MASAKLPPKLASTEVQEKYRSAGNNSEAELGRTDKSVRSRENLGCFFPVDYLLQEIGP